MSISYEKEKVMHHFMSGNHEVIDSRTGIQHHLEGIIEYAGDWYHIGGLVKEMPGSPILSVYYDSEDNMLHLSHMLACRRNYTFGKVFKHDTVRLYNNPFNADGKILPEDKIKQIIFDCESVLTEDGWIAPETSSNPVRQYLNRKLIIDRFLMGDEEVYDDSTGEMCHLSRLVEFNHDKFIAGWVDGHPGYLHMVYYDSEDDMLHLDVHGIGYRINALKIRAYEIMLYNRAAQTHGDYIKRIIDKLGYVMMKY